MFKSSNGKTSLCLIAINLGIYLVISISPVSASEIHKAANSGETTKLLRILESGEDVGAKDQKGNTPLHYAAAADNAAALKLLIAKGADVNATNPEGAMPLHYAVYFGRVSNVEYLIAYGALTNPPHPDGNPTNLAKKVADWN